jgi:hypothetical protein
MIGWTGGSHFPARLEMDAGRFALIVPERPQPDAMAASFRFPSPAHRGAVEVVRRLAA